MPYHTPSHSITIPDTQYSVLSCSTQLQLRDTVMKAMFLYQWSYFIHIILWLQRERGVMASSAPITPAFLPPRTATASRSVPTAPMSTTVVSDARCLEESTVFIRWVKWVVVNMGLRRERVDVNELCLEDLNKLHHFQDSVCTLCVITRKRKINLISYDVKNICCSP